METTEEVIKFQVIEPVKGYDYMPIEEKVIRTFDHFCDADKYVDELEKWGNTLFIREIKTLRTVNPGQPVMKLFHYELLPAVLSNERNTWLILRINDDVSFGRSRSVKGYAAAVEVLFAMEQAFTDGELAPKKK